MRYQSGPAAFYYIRFSKYSKLYSPSHNMSNQQSVYPIVCHSHSLSFHSRPIPWSSHPIVCAISLCIQQSVHPTVCLSHSLSCSHILSIPQSVYPIICPSKNMSIPHSVQRTVHPSLSICPPTTAYT